MAAPDRNDKRRSLYVQQNKAYQIMLSVMLIVFILISVVVAVNISTGGNWSDSLFIRMVFERRN